MSDTPKPQYGFMLCAADDRERTHFWCPLLNSWSSHRIYAPSQDSTCPHCGIYWLREIPAPDGKPWAESEWELVPENEPLGDFRGESYDGVRWRHHFWNSDSVTAGQACDYCDGKEGRTWCIAFARRKSPKIQPKAEAGQWVFFSERKPRPGDFPLFAVFSDSGTAQCNIIQVPVAPTNWHADYYAFRKIASVDSGAIPPPPAPEKSEAEVAWEKWFRDIGKLSGATKEDAFLAGFTAAKGVE